MRMLRTQSLAQRENALSLCKPVDLRSQFLATCLLLPCHVGLRVDLAGANPTHNSRRSACLCATNQWDAVRNPALIVGNAP